MSAFTAVAGAQGFAATPRGLFVASSFAAQHGAPVALAGLPSMPRLHDGGLGRGAERRLRGPQGWTAGDVGGVFG